MTEPHRALTDAIRSASADRTWSRGVVINREGGVDGLEEGEDELVFEVRTKDRPLPVTVVLYPETEEWDCDCGTRLEVCPHVVAAVLALGQARAVGSAMPESRRPKSHLQYRLASKRGLLELTRWRVGPDGSAEPLTDDPKRAASSRPGGAELVLCGADLELEPLLRRGKTLIDSREQTRLLFSKLADAKEVLLGERIVRVEPATPVLPRGRVTKAKPGFRLVIDRDPAVDEIVGPEVARVGDALRLLGEVPLTGPRLEKLPIARSFSPDEVGKLVQEVLPMFEDRFPIAIETELPRQGGRGRPQLHFEVAMRDRSISVTPRLVYGDPPTLRIESGAPVVVGTVIPTRDREAENRLAETLRSELNLRLDHTTTVDGADGAALLARVRRFQAEAGQPAEEADAPLLVPKLQVSEAGALMLELEGEDPDGRSVGADPRAALAAFEAGHGMVPLLDGGWGRLSPDWWRSHADQVAMLLRARDADGRPAPFALPAVAELAASLDAPPPAGLDRLAPLLAGFEGLPASPLPDDLNAELRDYQRVGVDWMRFLGAHGLGGLLADDMGLGKTLQTICVLERRSLVVCPTSVIANWAKEIARFRPGLKVHVHHGPRRVLDPGADVVLTTYGLMRADVAELEAERWSVFVLDEAQAIKNPESLTARAAHRISAHTRLALTGTPVENRLDELWSQMHFTNPGLLGSRSEFEARFARPIEVGDQAARHRLRARTKPFVLRRLKRDVAMELPPRTDMVLRVSLDEGERAAYEAVLASTRRDVVERLDTGGSPLQVLEALLRLRQAACHTGLLPGRSAEGSSKLDLLVETLEEAVSEGHKALVFSQWTQLLDLTEPWLARSGLAYLRLDGSTRDRGAVVERFQQPDGPPVLLISLKAGGTGLNLTAADHVFLLDPWWNPATEDQAADRAHRIGQDRPVFVHRLVAENTVEERILDLQERKRALAEVAVGGAGEASRITRDDLLALIEPAAE